jgi:tetratricopeptide (TPR) repeat protein
LGKDGLAVAHHDNGEPPALAEARVGNVLKARGHESDALAALEAGREIWRRLVDHDPTRGEWQADLAVAESRIGNVLQALGDLSHALAAFEASRDIYQRLVSRDPTRRDWQREHAIAESRLGRVLRASGE